MKGMMEMCRFRRACDRLTTQSFFGVLAGAICTAIIATKAEVDHYERATLGSAVVNQQRRTTNNQRVSWHAQLLTVYRRHSRGNTSTSTHTLFARGSLGGELTVGTKKALLM